MWDSHQRLTIGTVVTGVVKCVIIITHYDQYFELADRVIKLSDGRIVSVVSRQSSHFKTA